ncbi:MAG: bifunctional UDP-sugar hydrolase/5'-nucleotidase, partial [Acidobacteriota bacterium]
MKRFPILLAAGLLVASCVSAKPPKKTRTVTILHFSDYHSHAVPFYAEGRNDTGGIARAIGYLRPLSKRDDTLIFSGGDMMNRGAPSWSDRYTCTEWSWLNGIVDAMAFGNHDADYGPEEFQRCRGTIDYPILSANLLDGNGKPVFKTNGKRYAVFTRNGIRIGVFALAGLDFQTLLKKANSPVPNVRVGDPIATAREVVAQLRQLEHADAVIMIGHEQLEDDIALAKAVPGIDVIFGTHSHRKRDIGMIEGADATWIISPFQYLTYISRVQLNFDCGTSPCRFTGLSGGLVTMDGKVPEDSGTRARVARMQKELELDPKYAKLFRPIGTIPSELSTEGQFERDSSLGDFATDVMRAAAGTDAALATASSFREPIPPGVVTGERLRAALPYPNKILTFSLPGSTLQSIL